MGWRNLEKWSGKRTRIWAMPLIKKTDYGTPASRSQNLVTLTIDGRSVTVPEGTSIMRAAMEIGVEIPKLCATDNIKSFGSCRLCVVEIEGRNGAPASCTTPVAPGRAIPISPTTLPNALSAIAASAPVPRCRGSSR
jgi:ferredoxin